MAGRDTANAPPTPGVLIETSLVSLDASVPHPSQPASSYSLARNRSRFSSHMPGQPQEAILDWNPTASPSLSSLPSALWRPSAGLSHTQASWGRVNVLPHPCWGHLLPLPIPVQPSTRFPHLTHPAFPLNRPAQAASVTAVAQELEPWSQRVRGGGSASLSVTRVCPL